MKRKDNRGEIICADRHCIILLLRVSIYKSNYQSICYHLKFKRYTPSGPLA